MSQEQLGMMMEMDFYFIHVLGIYAQEGRHVISRLLLCNAHTL